MGIKECVTFMGHKVQDMTRDGLLEAIKWMQWEKGDEVGIQDDAPEMDYDKIKEKYSPFPRLEVISIQPGDLLVMTIKDKIVSDREDLMIRNMEREFPGNKCLVLCDGDTFKVYREKEKV